MEKEQKKGKKFSELRGDNPCEGCPAPCCQMLVTPNPAPRTMREIDHMHYSIQFKNVEIAIAPNGEWSLVRWEQCNLFKEKSCTCSVHNTPKQPIICRDYSPFQCWYKRNFVDNQSSPDVYRLNRERFELWLSEIVFNDSGIITSFPEFLKAKEMVEKIPLDKIFKSNAQLNKQ